MLDSCTWCSLTATPFVAHELRAHDAEVFVSLDRFADVRSLQERPASRLLHATSGPTTATIGRRSPFSTEEWRACTRRMLGSLGGDTISISFRTAARFGATGSSFETGSGQIRGLAAEYAPLELELARRFEFDRRSLHGGGAALRRPDCQVRTPGASWPVSSTYSA